MQVKRVPEESAYSCAGCVYKPDAGGCAHPEGEQGFECNLTNSIYKSFTACRVTKHKEEYRALHRANDPATSKGTRKVNKYEQAVLAALGADSPFSMDKRGYTGKEIAHHTGHPLNCITPRFAPLRRKGLITSKRDAMGQVEKRDKQIVWVLA